MLKEAENHVVIHVLGPLIMFSTSFHDLRKSIEDIADIVGLSHITFKKNGLYITIVYARQVPCLRHITCIKVNGEIIQYFEKQCVCECMGMSVCVCVTGRQTYIHTI